MAEETEVCADVIDRTCCICGDPRSFQGDQIRFCDGCDVATHISCYGVTPDEEVSYRRCKFCELHRAETTAPGKPPAVRCQICHQTASASPMALCNVDNAYTDFWVHTLCALAIRCSFRDFAHRNCARLPLPSAIDNSMTAGFCSVCGEPSGIKVVCQWPECEAKAHPICTRMGVGKQHFLNDVSRDGKFMWPFFVCKTHVGKLLSKSKKGYQMGAAMTDAQFGKCMSYLKRRLRKHFDKHKVYYRGAAEDTLDATVKIERLSASPLSSAKKKATASPSSKMPRGKWDVSTKASDSAMSNEQITGGIMALDLPSSLPPLDAGLSPDIDIGNAIHSRNPQSELNSGVSHASLQLPVADSTEEKRFVETVPDSIQSDAILLDFLTTETSESQPSEIAETVPNLMQSDDVIISEILLTTETGETQPSDIGETVDASTQLEATGSELLVAAKGHSEEVKQELEEKKTSDSSVTSLKQRRKRSRFRMEQSTAETLETSVVSDSDAAESSPTKRLRRSTRVRKPVTETYAAGEWLAFASEVKADDSGDDGDSVTSAETTTTVTTDDLDASELLDTGGCVFGGTEVAQSKRRRTRGKLSRISLCHKFPFVAPKCVDLSKDRKSRDLLRTRPVAGDWHTRDCWQSTAVAVDTSYDCQRLWALHRRDAIAVCVEYGFLPTVVKPKFRHLLSAVSKEAYAAAETENQLVNFVLEPLTCTVLERAVSAESERKYAEKFDRLVNLLLEDSAPDSDATLQKAKRLLLANGVDGDLTRDVFIDSGGALLAMDVLSTDDCDHMYVALSTDPCNKYHTYSLDTSPSEVQQIGCLIQIWKVQATTEPMDDGLSQQSEEWQIKSPNYGRNVEDSVVEDATDSQPICELLCCFIHSGGVVTDLQWHKKQPQTGTKQTPGLLAVCSSTDGALSIYSIEESAVETALRRKTQSEGSVFSSLTFAPKCVALQPSAILQLESGAGVYDIAKCSWSPHCECPYIAAGSSQGDLVVWDLRQISDLLATDSGHMSASAIELVNAHIGCVDASDGGASPIAALDWATDYPLHVAVTTMDGRLSVYNVADLSQPLFERSNHRLTTALQWIPGMDAMLLGSEKWTVSKDRSAAVNRTSARDPSAMVASMWSPFLLASAKASTQSASATALSSAKKGSKMGWLSCLSTERVLGTANRIGWAVHCRVECSALKVHSTERGSVATALCAPKDATVVCTVGYSDGSVVSGKHALLALSGHGNETCATQVLSQTYLCDWLQPSRVWRGEDEGNGLVFGGPFLAVGCVKQKQATAVCEELKHVWEPLRELKLQSAKQFALDDSVAVRRVFAAKRVFEDGRTLTHVFSAGVKGVVRVQTFDNH